MNSEEPKPEIELGRNWPAQIIVDHAPYWRAWRKQVPPIKANSEAMLELIGQTFIRFANGKNLGPRLMIEWMEHVRKIPGNKKGTTIGNSWAGKYRATIKAYIRWLFLCGAITNDPSECLPIVRTPVPAPKRVFTHEEYLKVRDYGMEHGRATEVYLWTLGYHSGMSLVDCLSLTWRDVKLVDGGASFIHRVREKMGRRTGEQSRSIIPIIAGGELWVWLKRQQREHELDLDRTGDGDYVRQEAGIWWENKRLDQPSETMANFIRSALGKDVADGRTFKHLRNTFASRLINSGIDAVLVSKMTGHSNVNQLAEYVLPDLTVMQDAILKALRRVEMQMEAAKPDLPKVEGGQCS